MKAQCEHEIEWDDQQSEPHKGHEYYYCLKCRSSFVLDNETGELVNQ